jgi:hypothetical protein
MAPPKKSRSKRENDVSVLAVLERIAAILLRLGFDAPRAEFLLRRAFVLAAQNLAGLSDARSTQSQIALIAGVNRLDVRRITAEMRHPYFARELDHQSRIGRVIDAWRHDPLFADLRGRPKALTIAGRTSEFAKLARMYGRDVTPRTLRETLLRKRLAVLNDKKIALVVRDLPKNDASLAGASDLSFLAAQLSCFDFHTGRRTFVTRNLTVSVNDKKSLKQLQRKAITRIGSALGALEESAKQTPQFKKDKPTRNLRLRITTTVASESDNSD